MERRPLPEGRMTIAALLILILYVAIDLALELRGGLR